MGRRVLRGCAAIGLVFAAIVLGIGILEGGLRLAGSDGMLQSEWQLTSRWVVLDDATITIPRRLLDPAFYTPPASPLIVTIGDSYTEGFPVAADDAYPAVLQRVLARRGVTATVRNAGMGDSGPDQQLRLLLTRLLPALRPSVVIWQLYANDVWDNALKQVYEIRGDRLEPVSGSGSWLARRQRFFDATPLPTDVKLGSRLYRRLLRVFEPKGGPRESEKAVAAALAKLDRELDEFERLGAELGFRPYFLLVAPQALYLHVSGSAREEWNVTAHRALRAAVADRPGFIDGHLGAGVGDRLFDARRDPAERGHRHLNERGYARIGVMVARRLLRDGVFAAAPQERAKPDGAPPGGGR